ncbi:hypothetical protein C8J56DRAFT_897493 [Mycena floridula]|nr:hypothetical protein C8J56DRAFT_897493 [Mycena floridula]
MSFHVLNNVLNYSYDPGVAHYSGSGINGSIQKNNRSLPRELFTLRIGRARGTETAGGVTFGDQKIMCYHLFFLYHFLVRTRIHILVQFTFWFNLTVFPRHLLEMVQEKEMIAHDLLISECDSAGGLRATCPSDPLPRKHRSSDSPSKHWLTRAVSGRCGSNNICLGMITVAYLQTYGLFSGLFQSQHNIMKAQTNKWSAMSKMNEMSKRNELPESNTNCKRELNNSEKQKETKGNRNEDAATDEDSEEEPSPKIHTVKPMADRDVTQRIRLEPKQRGPSPQRKDWCFPDKLHLYQPGSLTFQLYVMLRGSDPRVPVAHFLSLNDRLVALTFKAFLTDLKVYALEEDWAKKVLTKLMNKKLKSGSFATHSQDMVYLNCLLEGTNEHQSDIHSQNATSLPAYHQNCIVTATIQNAAPHNNFLQGAFQYQQPSNELQNYQNQYRSNQNSFPNQNTYSVPNNMPPLNQNCSQYQQRYNQNQQLNSFQGRQQDNGYGNHPIGAVQGSGACGPFNQ